MSQVRDAHGRILTDEEHRNQRLHDIAIGVLFVLSVEGAVAMWWFFTR